MAAGESERESLRERLSDPLAVTLALQEGCGNPKTARKNCSFAEPRTAGAARMLETRRDSETPQGDPSCSYKWRRVSF